MFFIYSEFCFWNKLDPAKIDDNLSQINFETILQMIVEVKMLQFVKQHLKRKFLISVQTFVTLTIQTDVTLTVIKQH